MYFKLLFKTSLLVFLTLSFFQLAAQTDLQRIEMVKRNPEKYYYGEGIANDWDDAKKKALANLTEQISVSVSSSNELTSEAVTDGDRERVRRELKEQIVTYTNATRLDGVKTATISFGSDGSDAHLFCYIERVELQKLFDSRRQRVINWVREGDRFENELKIADALESYYYGLLLLKSLPRPDTVSYIAANGEKRNMTNYLSRHIQSVIDNVNFEVGEMSGDENRVVCDMRISYKGKPVANCAYRYFDGSGMFYPNIAKDGHGVAEFVTRPGKINVKVEYEFSERMKSNIDYDLINIYQNLDKNNTKPKFKNLQEVTVGNRKLNENSDAVQTAGAGRKMTAKAVAESKLDSCTANINKIVKAIQSKNYGSVRTLFTQQGWEMFQQLVANGNATIIRKPELDYLVADDVIVCRSLPMSFKFPRSGNVVVENVTFRFSPSDLKIESLAFMLNEAAENDILDTNKSWSEPARLVLIQFLEDYQTAYSLKRIDYLDTIFSENALIITGTKVHRAPKIENAPQLKKEFEYKYKKSTKSEYISKLRNIFNTNEYVNLRLKDNDILKANGREMYGIQIRQLYSSSRYADEGYLFLLVDLRDTTMPVIHVRTWQPEKDPDFGLFDIHSFKMP